MARNMLIARTRMLRQCRTFAILVCAMLHSACDHGLTPELSPGDTVPGISGTLRVVSPWPPNDSLHNFRIVVFRAYPPANIIEEFLKGTLQFSDEIPIGFTEYQYTMQSERMSGVYQYVVAAQQYGSDPFKHWRVVGVYTTTGDVTQPSPINLGTGAFLAGVDITIDFVNLPPQPF